MPKRPPSDIRDAESSSGTQSGEQTAIICFEDTDRGDTEFAFSDTYTAAVLSGDVGPSELLDILDDECLSFIIEHVGGQSSDELYDDEWRSALMEWLGEHESELDHDLVISLCRACTASTCIAKVRSSIKAGDALEATYWTLYLEWARSVRIGPEEWRGFLSSAGRKGGRPRRSPDLEEKWLTEFDELQRREPNLTAEAHYAAIGEQSNPRLHWRTIQRGCTQARRRRETGKIR